MNRAAFAPLELLKNKPQPKKKEEVVVQIGRPAPAAAATEEAAAAPSTAEGVEIEESDESADSDISISPAPATAAAADAPSAIEPAHKVHIVDMRRDIDINRALIMQRLRGVERVVSAVPPGGEIPPPPMATVAAPAAAPATAVVKKKGRKTVILDVAAPAPEAAAAEEEAAPAAPAAEEVFVVKRPARGRKTVKPPPKAEVVGDVEKIVIGDTIVADRLPPKRPLAIHRLNSYYMANRKVFMNTINKLFAPYEEELKSVEQFSCDQKETNDFALLTHQKVVRDYLNLYTPYRGLLLFHGLGSGKTCTSIAIAEGMKSQRKIVVMTPASLKMNYFSELKKCGDEMYKRSQFWEFVSTDGHPEYVDVLSRILSLPPEYVQRRRGAWLVNMKKTEENYSELNEQYQKAIDEQLNQMILSKYMSINYNGLNENKMDMLTAGGTRNPFDNTVVVIDEAHNFVSRIVNKLKQKKSISYRLYDYLMSAENVRVVLLTGTPIINYPNEIAVLFNLLRGYIKTWSFQVTSERQSKLNQNSILRVFEEEGLRSYDYIQFTANRLTITRNPFSFANTKKSGRAAAAATAEENELFEKYGGVTLDEKNALTDAQFIKRVGDALKKHNLVVERIGAPTKYKPLPDEPDEFMSMFLTPQNELRNVELLKKRILGLTSYFRSAQEQLLPKYSKTGDFHVIECAMSDYQFDLYAAVRQEEITKEKSKKKRKRSAAAAAEKPGEIFKDVSSTYRIMSRAHCNFAFPEDVERPMPNHDALAKNKVDADELMAELDEDDVDPLGAKEAADATAPDEITDAQKTLRVDPTYLPRIKKALEELERRGNAVFSPAALETYSPKFLHMLENITDEDNIGLHLVYTTFRTVEGIALFKTVLEQNGFAEFKLKKDEASGDWSIVEREEDIGKPRFALYTGTETAEEKELIRNIYNGAWNSISPALSEKLQRISPNNLYGEIVKVLMITAAGSEGINLKNTRYVHITEPYWHPVRTEQVIGRARRICSHAELPVELRNVTVYLYLSTFTEEQKKTDKYLELRTYDRSKNPRILTPITTDEYLYEISNIKENITQQILRAVKETAIDCRLYNKKLTENGEKLQCYGMLNVKTAAFASHPTIDEDAADTAVEINKRRVEWTAKEVQIRGKTYAFRQDTGNLYDMENYQDLLDGRVVDIQPVGKLKFTKAGKVAGAEFF